MNDMPKFDKARLMVEVAFLQASIKTSRTWQEARFKRNRVKDLNRIIENIEREERSSQRNVAALNVGMKQLQKDLKRRGINQNTRLVRAYKKNFYQRRG